MLYGALAGPVSPPVFEARARTECENRVAVKVNDQLSAISEAAAQSAPSTETWTAATWVEIAPV